MEVNCIMNHEMLNIIFNIWDPSDVMYHAPDDEYRQLTDEVFELIDSSMSREEIFEIVYQKGQNYFNDFSRMIVSSSTRWSISYNE